MALVVKDVNTANKAAIERAVRTKEDALIFVSFVDNEVYDFLIAGANDRIPEGYHELGKMVQDQEHGIKFLYAIADYE